MHVSGFYGLWWSNCLWFWYGAVMGVKEQQRETAWDAQLHQRSCWHWRQAFTGCTCANDSNGGALFDIIDQAPQKLQHTTDGKDSMHTEKYIIHKLSSHEIQCIWLQNVRYRETQQKFCVLPHNISTLHNSLLNVLRNDNYVKPTIKYKDKILILQIIWQLMLPLLSAECTHCPATQPLTELHDTICWVWSVQVPMALTDYWWCPHYFFWRAICSPRICCLGMRYFSENKPENKFCQYFFMYQECIIHSRIQTPTKMY
jgi:hypothetical protein